LAQEAAGEGLLVGAVVLVFVGIQRGIVPQRLAVAPPEAVQRPAWQLLSRVPFALSEVLQPLRGVVSRASAGTDLGGALSFGRAEGFGAPFGAVVVVDRDEGRFAAHGQADVVAARSAVDLTWPSDSIACHCSSLYGRVTRGASQTRSMLHVVLELASHFRRSGR
jgi:hypothetical protein